MNNSLVRLVVGVFFSVLSGLAFLGLALYGATWGTDVTKWVAVLFVAALLGAVVSFKWEEFKTLPADLHEFFVEEQAEENPLYVDTSDRSVPYQSPWTLEAPKNKTPRAKAMRW